ncbi:MAG: hypothetical protein K2Q20_00700 [Phycisphaerales bacterium]|nr:hypothetical protein [Phycisphaerales bacterium]
MTLLVKSWNLEASRQARAAGRVSLPFDPAFEAVDWIGMAMPLLGLMAIMIGLRRFKARLRRERFAFCPGCEYDLTATRRAAHCPECGRAFGPKGYIREWGRIYPRRGRRWGDPMAIVRHPEGDR